MVSPRSGHQTLNDPAPAPDDEPAPERGFHVPEWPVPLLMLVVGGGLVVFARDYVYISPATGPGPGFFPTWLGAVLVVLSAVLLVRSLARRRSSGAGRVERAGALALFTGLTALGIVLMYVLGAIPALFVLVLLEMRFVERHGWLRSAVTGVLVAVAVFLVFEVALEVPLPGRLAELVGLA